jgi:hypothetical protein
VHSGFIQARHESFSHCLFFLRCLLRFRFLTCPAVERLLLQIFKLSNGGFEVIESSTADLLLLVFCRLAIRGFVNVISSFNAGRALTGDDANWDFVHFQPNRFWTLLPFFQNPSSISDYMAANCTNRELGGDSFEGRYQHFHFSSFTGDYVGANGSPPHIDVSDTFGMCVDTFGAYDTYIRCSTCYCLTYADIFEACVMCTSCSCYKHADR